MQPASSYCDVPPRPPSPPPPLNETLYLHVSCTCMYLLNYDSIDLVYIHTCTCILPTCNF